MNVELSVISFQIKLSGCSMNKLPRAICSLIKVARIDLDNNKLTQLPNDLQNMKSLRRIFLQQNNFASFPAALCHVIQVSTHGCAKPGGCNFYGKIASCLISSVSYLNLGILNLGIDISKKRPSCECL